MEPPTASEPTDDTELELLVYGNRLKYKRSDLIKAYDLGGLPDEHIIRVAQKEIAADQRLREAKEAADQRQVLILFGAFDGAARVASAPPRSDRCLPVGYRRAAMAMARALLGRPNGVRPSGAMPQTTV